MNPYTVIKHKTPGRFRVGDRARLKYGWPDAIAEVVQDLGPLGVGGRRYYHIRLMRPDAEDMLIDWPEEELLPLDADEGHGNATA